MTVYLQTLKTLFAQQADPTQAQPMKQYMRNQFEFLGIKSPVQKNLFKQFVTEQGLPELSQLESIVRELWNWPEREYQYVALAFLGMFQKHLTPDCLPLLEHLITTKSWWDTVDSIASHPVGRLLQQYPSSREAVIDQWRHQDNLWLRRTTILFQLGYKTETDERLLFALVEENQDSLEFFIQKAIGWALREYSKTAPEAVQSFVARAALASLSQREALKWLKAQTR